MIKTNNYNRIIEMLHTKLNVDAELQIDENTLLYEIGIDSIGLMALIVYIEEDFQKPIDIDNLGSFDTLRISHLVKNL